MPQHEQGPTLKRQVSHVRTDLLLHGAHMGLPWAVFLALTIFGNVLRLVSAHDPAFSRYLWLTTGLVVAAGAGTAAWDLLLRRHRMTGAGRLVGPVTTGAATVMLAAFLLAGYAVPLVLIWMIGGVAGCLAWDGWLHHAAAHELTIGFGAAAEAAGLGKASLVVRERPRAPRRPGAAPAMRGSIVHAGGEVTQADVAARGANLEAAGRYPPGAFSPTPSAGDAAVTDFIVSDPRVLEHSDPWPGPHAPGAGMDVPFRVGTWQTGEVALIPRRPLFHTRGMGMTGSAKALKLDTLVPVPSGWTTMGELRDGDEVFDDAGRPCRVVRAHPVLYGQPCYEVVFSDGSVITACADHLWEVDTRSSRLSADAALRPDLRPRKTAAHRPQAYKHILPRVVTTTEMAARVRAGNGALEYSVRVAAPLQCPDADLPVPPYTLGAWLGDGTAQTGSITTVDPEIIGEVEAEGMTVRIVPSTAGPGKAPLYRVAGLSRLLLAAGTRERIPGRCTGRDTLRGVKHIPVAYQRASQSQRRALLAGLLDTDGTCGPSGGVVFTSTSERLARDVLHLVSGLGYKASLRGTPARLYGKDCGTAWRVSFTPADKVFRLPRKAARQVTTVRRTALRRYVTEVRPVPSVPVRCITVDSPSSLYLAGQACIPTHNTMGWGYNQLGEGVTRQDYAAMVLDPAKGEQFFGAWRPALHRFETDEGKALYLLRALHRARRARSDYLGRKHLDQWEDSCGLSWLDLFLAEAPDVIRLLETAKSRTAGAVMSLDDWLSDVKNGRSAGMSWNLDLQLSLAAEMPTVAQGQMSHLCLGVESKKQAAFGLSARQIDATTCRPELWGKKQPGMAYWDVPTLPDQYATVPLRFFYWDGGIRQAFEYAAQWPSAGRPLDDVTGEALEAEPAPPPSQALPGPGGTLAGSQPPPGWGRNVRPLFGKGSGKQAVPSLQEQAEAAENAVFAVWDAWLAAGKTTFAHLELERSKEFKALGRSRPWLYGVYKSGIAAGRIRKMDTGTARARYEIIPLGQRQAGSEEEA